MAQNSSYSAHKPSHALPSNIHRSSNSYRPHRRTSQQLELSEIATRAKRRKGATGSQLSPVSSASTTPPNFFESHRSSRKCSNTPYAELPPVVQHGRESVTNYHGLRNSSFASTIDTPLSTPTLVNISGSGSPFALSPRATSFREDTRDDDAHRTASWLPILNLEDEQRKNEYAFNGIAHFEEQLEASHFALQLSHTIGHAILMYYQGRGSEMKGALYQVREHAEFKGDAELSARAQLWLCIILHAEGKATPIPQLLGDIMPKIAEHGDDGDCFQLRKLLSMYSLQVWQYLQRCGESQRSIKDEERLDFDSEEAQLYYHVWQEKVLRSLEMRFDKTEWPNADEALLASSIKPGSSEALKSSSLVAKLRNIEQENANLRIENEKLALDRLRYKAERELFTHVTSGDLSTGVSHNGAFRTQSTDFEVPTNSSSSMSQIPASPDRVITPTKQKARGSDMYTHGSQRQRPSQVKRHPRPIQENVQQAPRIEDWREQIKPRSSLDSFQSPNREQWGSIRLGTLWDDNYSQRSSPIGSSVFRGFSGAYEPLRSIDRRYSWRPSSYTPPRLSKVRNDASRHSTHPSPNSGRSHRNSYARERLSSGRPGKSASKNSWRRSGDQGPSVKGSPARQAGDTDLLSTDSSQSISLRSPLEQNHGAGAEDQLRLLPADGPEQLKSDISRPVGQNLTDLVNDALRGQGVGCDEALTPGTIGSNPHFRPFTPSRMSAQQGRRLSDIAGTELDSDYPSARPSPLVATNKGKGRNLFSPAPLALTTSMLDAVDVALTDTPSPKKLKQTIPNFEEHQEQRRRSLSFSVSVPTSPSTTSYEAERLRSRAHVEQGRGGNASREDPNLYRAIESNDGAGRIARSGSDNLIPGTRSSPFSHSMNEDERTKSSSTSSDSASGSAGNGIPRTVPRNMDGHSLNVPGSKDLNRGEQISTRNTYSTTYQTGSLRFVHQAGNISEQSTSASSNSANTSVSSRSRQVKPESRSQSSSLRSTNSWVSTQNAGKHASGPAPLTPSTKSSPSSAITLHEGVTMLALIGAAKRSSSMLSAEAPVFVPQDNDFPSASISQGSSDNATISRPLTADLDMKAGKTLGAKQTQSRISSFLTRLETENAATTNRARQLSKPTISSPLRRSSRVSDPDEDDNGFGDPGPGDNGFRERVEQNHKSTKNSKTKQIQTISSVSVGRANSGPINHSPGLINMQEAFSSSEWSRMLDKHPELAGNLMHAGNNPYLDEDQASNQNKDDLVPRSDDVSEHRYSSSSHNPPVVRSGQPPHSPASSRSDRTSKSGASTTASEYSTDENGSTQVSTSPHELKATAEQSCMYENIGNDYPSPVEQSSQQEPVSERSESSNDRQEVDPLELPIYQRRYYSAQFAPASSESPPQLEKENKGNQVQPSTLNHEIRLGNDRGPDLFNEDVSLSAKIDNATVKPKYKSRELDIPYYNPPWATSLFPTYEKALGDHIPALSQREQALGPALEMPPSILTTSSFYSEHPDAHHAPAPSPSAITKPMRDILDNQRYVAPWSQPSSIPEHTTSAGQPYVDDAEEEEHEEGADRPRDIDPRTRYSQGTTPPESIWARDRQQWDHENSRDDEQEARRSNDDEDEDEDKEEDEEEGVDDGAKPDGEVDADGQPSGISRNF